MTPDRVHEILLESRSRGGDVLSLHVHREDFGPACLAQVVWYPVSGYWSYRNQWAPVNFDAEKGQVLVRRRVQGKDELGFVGLVWIDDMYYAEIPTMWVLLLQENELA